MTPAGVLGEPETAQQHEAGIKTEPFEGKTLCELGRFHIQQEKVQRIFLTGVPPASGDMVQTGEEQSQGVELDVTGRILLGGM